MADQRKKMPVRKSGIDGRQRVICDKSFWRSNSLTGCSVEDKYLLMYFLTSPFSGTSGVFEIKTMVVAAEIGWDCQTQLKPVLHRLVDLGLLEYDEQSHFVWVKIWWEHNVASQVGGDRLIEKTIDEILRMPEQWRLPFLQDYQMRTPDSAEKICFRIAERLGSNLAEQTQTEDDHPISRLKRIVGLQPTADERPQSDK